MNVNGAGFDALERHGADALNHCPAPGLPAKVVAQVVDGGWCLSLNFGRWPMRRLASAIFARFAYMEGPTNWEIAAMPAPFPVRAVANAILEKSFAEKRPVSPLKLQKLLYYAHGYYSAAYGKPLIDQPFEAWQYGPVVPAAYHEFKEFGNGPITRPALDRWTMEEDIPVPAVFDDDTNVRRVIDYVWKQYAHLPAVSLSEMTHRPDSPWDKTMKANIYGLKNVDIPQTLIDEYFKPLIKKSAA